MPQRKEFWSRRRVVVTGGAGFLGAFVVETLRRRGCSDLWVPRRAAYDLRDPAAVSRLYALARPDIVIHLAASVGGIGANMQYPGQFFYDNALMGLHMIEEARQCGVEKFVCAGTVCSYPKVTPVPFAESNLWNGYPEETNAPYGLAKKMLLVQLEAYRREYGLRGIYLIPANLYGPGDHFDLETSHVIPAMIRKCVEAKQRREPLVTAWGTGRPTREFLYVEDAAEAIVLAAERYEDIEPINLGSGQEISIGELAHLIKELVGYPGQIIWDRSKPDGQPRRSLDTTSARRALGWQSRVPLRVGLQKTIDWFVANREALATELT